MSGSFERTLRLHPGRLAVWRLPPEGEVPEELWRRSPQPLLGWVRTGNELSIVGPEELAPEEAPRETGFRALELVGPLDFAWVGVLRSVLEPLGDAGVAVFVLSTFDTDWILLREERLEDAAAALGGAGLRVIGPE